MYSAAALALPRRQTFSQSPAIVTSDRQRPQMPSGIQIGDVLADRAMIWSRSDRPARLVVERSSHEHFTGAVRVRGPIAQEAHDYVARLDLTGLVPDQQTFVRVYFEDPWSGRTLSEAVTGRFRTAPRRPRNVRFAWSADTAGQGFGINAEWGGMKIYDTIRKTGPDFFIHCGDTIYADSPIPPAVTIENGAVWKNLVTEETSKVAESLREFRGRYQYNLLDANVLNFSAAIPQIWQWDDHEVMNNWSDSKDLSEDSRYTEKSIRVLAARARQAFLEYAPMRYHSPGDSQRVYRRIPYGPLLDVLMLDERSYRGPNSYNRQERPGPDTAFLGVRQLEWLKRSLLESTALWKVVSSDMPIGLIVSDGQDRKQREMYEAVANGDGPVLGREFEYADLFRFIKRHRIRNVIWITADVHYTAAHFYDPARAQFQDFDPFWEFVSGPLNAGSFGPNVLDDTFGPRVVFQKVPPTQNAAPSAGYQFFGQVDVDGASGEMTVTLADVAGNALFVQPLTPDRN
jgi:alkaline phosphatase D